MDRIRDLGTSRDMLGDEEDLRGLSGLVENITKVLVRDEWEGGRARCNLYPEQPIRGDWFSASRRLSVTPIFETCRAQPCEGRTSEALKPMMNLMRNSRTVLGQVSKSDRLDARLRSRSWHRSTIFCNSAGEHWDICYQCFADAR